MCHTSVKNFVLSHLDAKEVAGKRVLEVGALDVNGTVRPGIEALGAAEYIATDMQEGQGVDQIVRAEDLVKTFGSEAFDIVISTEMLEHAEDWRSVIDNMKQVCRDMLVVTTRGPGFPLHGYPSDYWRYTVEDMQKIFADFDIITLLPDPEAPGVMLKARKTSRKPVDLSKIEVTPIQ